MSAVPQILASQKASLDHFLALQNTVFNGFEKLVDLNLKVVRATLDEAAQKSQEATELTDAQDSLAFASNLAQPSAEKAMAYSKHVYDILSGVQTELNKLVEVQVARGQQQLSEAIEHLSKNAPAGSEGAVSLLKSSLASANNAYESVAKAAKQAADAAETNITAAANATLKAATDAAAAAKPATRSRRTTAA